MLQKFLTFHFSCCTALTSPLTFYVSLLDQSFLRPRAGSHCDAVRSGPGPQLMSQWIHFHPQKPAWSWRQSLGIKGAPASLPTADLCVDNSLAYLYHFLHMDISPNNTLSVRGFELLYVGGMVTCSAGPCSSHTTLLWEPRMWMWGAGLCSSSLLQSGPPFHTLLSTLFSAVTWTGSRLRYYVPNSFWHTCQNCDGICVPGFPTPLSDLAGNIFFLISKYMEKMDNGWKWRQINHLRGNEIPGLSTL